MTVREAEAVKLQAGEIHGWLDAIRNQEEAREGATHTLTGSPALLTAPFQISSLRNCERIHFCYQATQFVGLCYGSPSKQMRNEDNLDKKCAEEKMLFKPKVGIVFPVVILLLNYLPVSSLPVVFINGVGNPKRNLAGSFLSVPHRAALQARVCGGQVCVRCRQMLLL